MCQIFGKKQVQNKDLLVLIKGNGALFFLLLFYKFEIPIAKIFEEKGNYYKK